ncbi:MAG: hypothetical protein Q4A81_07215 [Pasteurellaceae bacterium]|nr:hypothetical protein [Pasteurellaceae bacterium]
MYNKFAFATILLTTQSVFASTISMHISEDGIVERSDSAMPSVKSKDTTYLSKNSSRQLDLNNAADRKALANSTEFEMYRITETQNTYTLFEGGAGVCNSFEQSAQGVQVTDSSTYYLNKQSKNEYYANIAGATLNSKSIKNVRYAPVFSINSSDVAKQLKAEDAKYGYNIAEKNLNERAQFLSKILCK